MADSTDAERIARLIVDDVEDSDLVYESIGSKRPQAVAAAAARIRQWAEATEESIRQLRAKPTSRWQITLAMRLEESLARALAAPSVEEPKSVKKLCGILAVGPPLPEPQQPEQETADG